MTLVDNGGKEFTWYFELEIPISLRIVKILRPRYALADESGIVVGTLPALPVEKGNADPGLITQIIIDKFVYNIPLYRQITKYKSE